MRYLFHCYKTARKINTNDGNTKKFPQYEYKFVYLNLVDTDIIKQIDNICKNFSAKGWDYYRLETSVIKHTPGCLSAIFGAQEYYTKHQYIVFRRPFKKNKDFLESSNIK